jgi:hypothetical protein
LLLCQIALHVENDALAGFHVRRPPLLLEHGGELGIIGGVSDLLIWYSLFEEAYY